MEPSEAQGPRQSPRCWGRMTGMLCCLQCAKCCIKQMIKLQDITCFFIRVWNLTGETSRVLGFTKRNKHNKTGSFPNIQQCEALCTCYLQYLYESQRAGTVSILTEPCRAPGIKINVQWMLRMKESSIWTQNEWTQASAALKTSSPHPNLPSTSFSFSHLPS